MLKKQILGVIENQKEKERESGKDAEKEIENYRQRMTHNIKYNL